MMSKHIGTTVMMASIALLAGCGGKEPSGQVAATVNGKEVTLQEVNSEIQANNSPSSMDKKIAQNIALDAPYR